MEQRKFRNYSEEFKLAAVQKYLDSEKGYAALCQELDIKDTKTLRTWVKKFKAGEILEDRRGKSTISYLSKSPDEFKSPAEEIVYLKAERDYLKKLYRSLLGKE